jgi:hypothetical protein
MIWSLSSYCQNPFHHGDFEVQWYWALHITVASGGQQDRHRRGGHSKRQRSSLDTELWPGDWVLLFQSRECDAQMWFHVAGSGGCNWRGSNCPCGSFYVLIHVFRLNTDRRFNINESDQCNETSSGCSESWSEYLTPWKNLSRGRYNPPRPSFRGASWMVFMFIHLFPSLPFPTSRNLFSGHCLWLSFLYQLARVRWHLWMSEHEAGDPPHSATLHHVEICIDHT